MLDTIIDFFNKILDFIQSGLYEFVTAAFGQFIIYTTIALIKFKLYMMVFAWDVAQQILAQLNITQQLNSAWAGIDSKSMQLVSFFRLPDALNIVLTARVTRYVLDFMGL
jgi:hypothetical protein